MSLFEEVAQEIEWAVTTLSTDAGIWGNMTAMSTHTGRPAGTIIEKEHRVPFVHKPEQEGSMAEKGSLEGEVFVGLDSEFFFVEPKLDVVVPAHMLLPNKFDPKVVVEDRTGASPDSTGKGVALHYDGIQGEFSAVESRNPQDVLRRIQVAVHHICELAEGQNLRVSLQGAIPVDIAKFDEYPEDAVEFGCDADYISWLDGVENPISCAAEDHAVRYAGTHLHLGVPEEEHDQHLIRTLLEPESRIEIVKTLDFLVGNTAVLLDQAPESTLRRQLYGKAGTFRPTDYGVEYRALSSFMMVSPHLLPTLWALARESVRLVMEGRQEELFEEIFPGHIIQAINDNDYRLAKKNWHEIQEALGGFFEEAELIETEELERKPLKALEFASQISLRNLLHEDWLKDHWTDDLTSWTAGYFDLFTENHLVDDFAEFLNK